MTGNGLQLYLVLTETNLCAAVPKTLVVQDEKWTEVAGDGLE